jgi:hypothetical protein
MSENSQQLEKKLKEKMTKLMTNRFANRSNQTRSESEMSKNTVSNDARTSANLKQASQSVKTIQIAKNAQAFEKSRTNASINSTSTSSSSI